MSSIVGQRIWLVGAASVIGAALAEELHRRGAILAISARREERLEEVSQGRFATVALDATDAAEQPAPEAPVSSTRSPGSTRTSTSRAAQASRPA